MRKRRPSISRRWRWKEFHLTEHLCRWICLALLFSRDRTKQKASGTKICLPWVLRGLSYFFAEESVWLFCSFRRGACYSCHWNARRRSLVETADVCAPKCFRVPVHLICLKDRYGHRLGQAIRRFESVWGCEKHTWNHGTDWEETQRGKRETKRQQEL